MALSKVFSFGAVVAGAVVFLVPIAWLFSTALKPLDQTTSYPPAWLPRESDMLRDGRWESALRLAEIRKPSQVVVDRRSGEEYLVDAGEARARLDGPDFSAGPEIPATSGSPWVRVRLGDGSLRAVPASDVRDRIAPQWGNFPRAIQKMGMFPRYLRNTLFLCLLTVTGTVLSSAMAAYGFARLSWPGRKAAFAVVLATMMIPFPVIMVPVYCLFRWLGWIGTFQPLWVGAFLAPAFSVFLLRQFFMTIPRELSEAARIDGCGEWAIFWKIILPLSRPALVVVGLFQFLGTWNDFIGPLIYLTDQKDFTLSLGLQFFQSQHGGTEWNLLMAACVLVVLPVMALFFFAQRFFTQGVALTGLKG